MCEKFRQLLATGRWFPPGTPVSSTRKLISSSSFHRLDMTLAVAEALNPNKQQQKQPRETLTTECHGGQTNLWSMGRYTQYLIMMLTFL